MDIASQTILNWIMQYGYIGLFCLLMFGIIGVPFPDEIIMTAAGYLVFKGYLQLAPTVLAAFMGSMCGISVSYTIGRVAGTRLLDKFGHLVHITPDRVKLIHEWFERFGKWTLLFGYFVTGFRHLVAIVAGTAKLKIPEFALFAYAGALLWSLTFISLGYFLGDQWTRIAENGKTTALGVIVLVCAIALIYVLKQRLVPKARIDESKEKEQQ
jgi:membrane protein DedA with SNARE-associated domain